MEIQWKIMMLDYNKWKISQVGPDSNGIMTHLTNTIIISIIK